jgi:hypothetical protein
MAIITLFVLSPLIAELLGGATPISRAEQLPLEALFYGSGALLIREFVRRNNLGWSSILLSGIAFGIIEEGLSLQSLFNPDFMVYSVNFRFCQGIWFTTMGYSSFSVLCINCIFYLNFRLVK